MEASVRTALERLPTQTTNGSPRGATLAQRGVDRVSGWLSRRISRRGFMVRAAVVGTAVAADPFGYVLRPGTAYASVCGPSSSCSSGWAVFCATINAGKNVCPPGSIAAGWWKADGASLCGGKARYIIDCNGTCRCSTPGARSGFCSKSCQSCRCGCGPSNQCDQRRVCCNDFRYGQCNQQVRQVGAVHCRVVSCTPPWRFERCSTATATDNATRAHSSPALPRAFTDISRRYLALGENGSVIGNTVYSELTVAGGRTQRYTAGRISWHASTGAWETRETFWTVFVRIGAEAGALGFPLRPRQPVGDGRGIFQRFQRGRITHHPTFSTRWIGEHVRSAYETLGYEKGQLGYPVTNQNALPDGIGHYCRFERGRITHHPTYATRWMGSRVMEVYRSLLAEPGRLGYPVTSQNALPDGVGHYCRFERGRITHHPTHGTRWMGAELMAVYRSLQAEPGRLGYPTSSEQVLPDDVGVYCRFERGRITHHPAHGTRWLGEALHAAYRRAGGEPGPLGYAVNDETPVEGSAGVFARLERGRLSSASPATGGHWMGEPIAQAYVAQYGGEAGELGYPTSDEYVGADARRRVDFTSASLVVTGGVVQREDRTG